MDSYTATGLAEGFIAGTEDEVIEAWQYLENIGLAYQLQGSFGRQCQAMIEAGVISPRSAQTEITMRTFRCEYTWSAPSGTGSSSYVIRCKNVSEAQARVRRAFAQDFGPGFTFGEFGTCMVIG